MASVTIRHDESKLCTRCDYLRDYKKQQSICQQLEIKLQENLNQFHAALMNGDGEQEWHLDALTNLLNRMQSCHNQYAQETDYRRWLAGWIMENTVDCI